MADLEAPLRVLAQSAGPLQWAGQDTELLLERVPQAQPGGHGTPADRGSPDPLSLHEGRWLILLDGVCGTHDATVLHLAWRPAPEADATAPASAQRRHLGSVALYGLRRASLEPGQSGLALSLDVTAQRDALLAWWSQSGQPLVLALSARPGAPVPVTLTLQAVRLAVSA